MHDNRTTTTQTSVYGLTVDMSQKRTVSHFRCCTLLHDRAESKISSRGGVLGRTLARVNFWSPIAGPRFSQTP